MQLDNIFTEQIIRNGFNQQNKKLIQLSEKLIKKYGFPKFLIEKKLEDYLSINFDVQLFCFTKSLRIYKSIDVMQ